MGEDSDRHNKRWLRDRETGTSLKQKHRQLIPETRWSILKGMISYL